MLRKQKWLLASVFVILSGLALLSLDIQNFLDTGLDSLNIESADFIPPRKVDNETSATFANVDNETSATFAKVDNGTSATSVEEMERNQTHSAEFPKIYMYEFPDSYRTFIKTANPTIDVCGNITGFEEHADCKFGKKIYFTTPQGKKLAFRNINHNKQALLFYERIKQSPLRVYDASEADIFYIPVWGTSLWAANIWELRNTCPDGESMFMNLHELNKDTARWHFQINSDIAMAGCYSWFLTRNFLSGVKDMQKRKLIAEKQELLRQGARLGFDLFEFKYGPLRVSYKPVNLFSIPYPSVASGLTFAEQSDLISEVFRSRERKYLVAAVFRVHISGLNMNVRRYLLSRCKELKECALLTAGGPRGLHAVDYIKRYYESTFCLQPEGDTPSRKAILDSMTLGCIPVLFAKLQTKLWPWHVGDWRDIGVIIPDDEYTTVWERLKNISSEQIEMYRNNIKLRVHRLSMRIDGGSRGEYDDGFDYTVTKLWASMK
eukprot:CAMPEP_0167751604 /NCGR_PEP_ID=MMETSP0110_2-20121227/6675_1 /TAXON_ID=629695 /ORGANISM="Gymnochlora sp., Strain CCMP2014" /LENGTH=491 /DNA_ID=CAMNT_0007637127 /DNA_START=31 /DNA_END=1506 /DNA_ORIENTATION=+